jgi:phosphatidylserine/phosphatidylglycerophosphate/cardiolipin synthase-like enzyme
MILRFPIDDFRSFANWEDFVTDTPFGPDGASGFSKCLTLGLTNGLRADLVAPFDGFLRRIVSGNVDDFDPLEPAIYELQPILKEGTEALADGLSGQMPRIRWHDVPVPLAQALRDRVIAQVRATDATQAGLREEKFAQGKFGIRLQRGDKVASGLTEVKIEVRTREGVSVDPIAYYHHYLALPAGPDDLLADRAFLEDLFSVLERRALVQLVDAGGAPLRESVVVRAPDGTTTEVDMSSAEGTLVQALFATAGPADHRIEAVTLSDPLLEPGEQPADHYVMINEWPSGDPELLFPIPAGTDIEHTVSLTEPAGPRFRRIVVTRLRNWLASQWVADEALRLPRYTTGNRVDALVDGLDAYEKMYEDIRAMPAAGTGRFFYLAGWRLALSLRLKGKEEASRFLALMEDLVANNAEVRILLWDQFRMDSATLHATLAAAVTALVTVGIVGMHLIPPLAVIIWALMSLSMLGVPALAGSDSLQEFVSRLVESNEGAVDDLIASGIKAFLDGKVRETRGNGFPVLYDFVGTHHQKFSIIARPGSAVAYCGGMDIWPDRLDDPGHFSPSPYHDLHTRIEGPAVADLVTTFRQRWDDQHPTDPANDGATEEGPTPNGRQVVQIARTYPSHLNPANESYPFAPEGDFTIRETLKQAIRQARRYIYIEDQYMTIPPVLRDIIRERMNDNDDLQLIMVLPRASDQPQNTMRRARIIGELLEDYGPNRVVTLFLTKLVTRHDPERHGPVMSRLRETISKDSPVIPLEDASQFADQGFLLIGGEEIRYTSRDITLHNLVTGPDGWRSFNNTQAAPHKKEEFVRQIEYRDIFVHAKLWIIDDVFASIGSANTNQRGMTHDSEVNVMLIDGMADRGARRFAKQLRIDLWADHLGLYDSAAARLVLDDIDEAIELLISNPGPAGRHLRRYWHTYESGNLKPESWLGFVNPLFYWDLLVNLDEVMLDDAFWQTYIDPDGSIPF